MRACQDPRPTHGARAHVLSILSYSACWQDQLDSVDARRVWALAAENEAITGSCHRSMESVKTGIRSWARFATGFLGLDRPYPAPLYGLLAWSKTFRCECLAQQGAGRGVSCRCADTFGNYLGYARVGSLLARELDEAFDAKVLGRAKVSAMCSAVMPTRVYSLFQIAIKKREAWVPRPRHFIQKPMLCRMIEVG